MKKKLLFLVLIPFVLAGCDATYTLTIDENTMTESASVLTNSSSLSDNELANYLQQAHMAYYDMNLKQSFPYSKKEIKEKNKKGINFEYIYREDNLQKSSLLNYCYYNKSVIKNDDYISIYTDGKATCFYKDSNKILNSLTIKIKTDLKVVENNADEVKNNTYIWYVTDKNFQNKPLNIKIKVPEEKKANTLLHFAIILAIVFAIILIVLYYVYRKGKKNNKL